MVGHVDRRRICRNPVLCASLDLLGQRMTESDKAALRSARRTSSRSDWREDYMADHLDQAQELLDNYWNREEVISNDGYTTDIQADAEARQAELLTIIAYALIGIGRELQKR